MNTVDSLTTEIREILKEKAVQDVKVLDQQRNILKVRLYLVDDLFVQVYRNDMTNNTSFSLIFEDERLYGRDEIEGHWHRHPFEDPSLHNGKGNGNREVTLGEFYREILEILTKEGII